ncbi:pyridoxamine 5'-phosphate oxidase family protein [Sinomonas atrocyanea]|uniref:pyridoxamine 5'-phosphate oxidase family protein n=1 Tax=Sinomonas atrocyanea TaxID=37927 RepID=UPI0027859020|nr:pyridoxamine 5'-phosphate oxidase family protein [Sinomonas atrocyanea]MDQ0260344.1 nitroimidazol reductase NimA-like FMN-containing flavoprotein (pyridoxamine 5'-phosphate oxidase superfamily) [Sinomonas atrocyanea]MDR6622428.1 nitroimidazol reductase NimA-like FMN-containing flavoprotein (pyridoxamine 5'-phosphate oxidase superfamily) [Sinomonas atrocyanea]
MLFDHDNDEPIRVLTDAESWELLDNARHGRLATAAAGELDIVPINFRSSGGKLYLKTTPGTKLAELTIHPQVAFEADGIMQDEAWSVVIKGTARVLEHSGEIAEAEAANIETWLPTSKSVYVEIAPTSIEGRHFQLGAEPEETTARDY